MGIQYLPKKLGSVSALAAGMRRGLRGRWYCAGAADTLQLDRVAGVGVTAAYRGKYSCQQDLMFAIDAHKSLCSQLIQRGKSYCCHGSLIHPPRFSQHSEQYERRAAGGYEAHQVQ